MGAIQSLTFGVAPDSTWVVVRVEGGLNLDWNPECANTSPYWPCHPGPPTNAFGERPTTSLGPVGVWAGSSRIGLRGAGGAGQDPGWAVGLFFNTQPRLLSAKLMMSALWAWNPMDGHGPFSYYVTGGYSVTTTAIESPLRLTAAPADSAGVRVYRLSADHGLELLNGYDLPSHWPPGAVRWYFFHGADVSEEPSFSGPFQEISACAFHTECAYAPPGPGRVQATAYVETKYAMVRRVSAMPDPCVESGGALFNVIPGSASTEDCGDEERELVLTCLPQPPATIPRGSSINCEVAADPSGELTEIRWSFVASSGETVTGPQDIDAWGGRMAIGGEISVTAKIDGEPASAQRTIVIEPRNWAGEMPAYPPALPAFSVDPDPFPTFPVVEDNNLYDVWVEGGLGLYYYGMDWGGKFYPIGSGPNNGFWYLATPPGWQTPSVAISGHLEPGHAFYEAQTGVGSGPLMPGYSGWCTKADMDALRQEVLQHEGAVAGPRLSHHQFNINYTGANDPGPAVEGVVFYLPPGAGEFNPAAAAALGEAYMNALTAANRAAVHAPSNLYTPQCKVIYP